MVILRITPPENTLHTHQKSYPCHLFVRDQGNLIPQFVIELTHQRIHEAVILLSEDFPFPFSYNLKLIGSVSSLSQGIGTFDNIISSFALDHLAHFIRCQIECCFLIALSASPLPKE